MNVFLSYAHQDRDWAEQFASRLRSAGLQVSDPGADVLPGENWATKAGAALSRADAVVVLLSPESVDSTWVTHEIQYALGSPQFKDRLIPVLVRPTSRIPWILRELKVVEAEDPLEAAEQVVALLRPGRAIHRTRSRAAR